MSCHVSLVPYGNAGDRTRYTEIKSFQSTLETVFGKQCPPMKAGSPETHTGCFDIEKGCYVPHEELLSFLCDRRKITLLLQWFKIVVNSNDNSGRKFKMRFELPPALTPQLFWIEEFLEP